MSCLKAKPVRITDHATMLSRWLKAVLLSLQQRREVASPKRRSLRLFFKAGSRRGRLKGWL